MIALIVDVVEGLTVYSSKYKIDALDGSWDYIVIALSAALFGAISGKLLLKKIKMKSLTIFISVAMIIFGVALCAGFLNK